MASSSSVYAQGRLYKVIKKQKTSECEDRISKLPGVIIDRILSFLPTKDAVRTCVLSKRWLYSWTFINDLFFQDRARVPDYKKIKIKKMCFVNFVNAVLLHLNNSTIQSFSLIISDKYDPCRVNEWISAVLSRSVKRLCLDSLERLALPSYSLTKFQYLEELVLMMDSYVIRVPSIICLSSLTILKLFGITFVPFSSNSLKMLYLNFPVLREYETKNCTWSSVKVITLVVPLLEVLLIENLDGSMPYEPHTEIKFCASRLKEFTYTASVLPNNIFLNVSAVKVASVCIDSSEFTEQIVQNVQESGFLVCKFLKQFNSKMECLKFRGLGVFEHPIDSLLELPPFQMLSHLELDIVTVENLLALLLKMPILKTLILKEVLKFNKELLSSAIVPDCFRSNLKVVKFGKVDGYECEVSFAKFVMENAEVLERICFTPTAKLRGVNLEAFKEKLFSLRRALSLAIIEFSI